MMALVDISTSLVNDFIQFSLLVSCLHLNTHTNPMLYQTESKTCCPCIVSVVGPTETITSCLIMVSVHFD